MRPVRVLSIFGTRPEAIKMAPVLREFTLRPDRFVSLVCATAQHRQMLDPLLHLFGITPDEDLDLMVPNQTLAGLTARAISAVDETLQRLCPDVILVQGDTTTAMAASLAGFYRRIPVGHVEAGLRTRDIYSPFPEEANRSIIGRIATLHFAPTETARAALLAERVAPDSVLVTGNTVIDALQETIARFGGESGAAVSHRRLIVVTAHRRENFGAPFERICRAIAEIVRAHPDVEVVYPVHLNPNVQAPVRQHLSGLDRVHLVEPMDYREFALLLNRAYLVLTDSGGLQEEAPALGKPVLVMRDETERPEAVDAGTVRLVGTDVARIVREAGTLLRDPSAYAAMATACSPYGDGHAAPRIADALEAHFHGLLSQAGEPLLASRPSR